MNTIRKKNKIGGQVTPLFPNMLGDNPDPDFGIDDEIDDLLSSGVKDNDNNDGEDSDGSDGGEGGDGGAGQANQDQAVNQPVNAQVDQEQEMNVENIVPDNTEPVVKESVDQGDNKEANVEGNESMNKREQVQNDQ
ncbi:hypothetical protein L1987_23491 [Smallanthus sonchifolius]|uniref:Uncharacterized protein n=1 Tax=Smallanthus sonchifolius TaxID=185202 RepID=A0ACB9IID9_9ASTR|nr:hypothetical protein L1987_23491 [Smallanthus sonchifolius]